MIQNLRRRLVILLMILLSVIFLLILFSINWTNYSFNMRQNRRMLRDTINHVGLEAFCEEAPSDPRLEDLSYCTIQITPFAEPKVLVNRLADITDEQMLRYTKEILNSTIEQTSTHSLVFVKKYRPGITYLVFMDNSLVIENSHNLLTMSLLFGVLGLFLLFGISMYLSRWLVEPVADSFETQKRFISDASHELKTPLTIISANVDLLEEESGTNKHVAYIRSETKRMGNLINQMLTLARLDREVNQDSNTVFSLSQAVLEIVLPFESVAYEHNITLDVDVPSSLDFFGNRDQLQQLTSILLDNAIGHTSPAGTIRVELKCQHKKIYLSVANTGAPIPAEKQKKIFERFYQADEARSIHGENYGLGLSIAKSVTERHRGRISVQCQDGVTTFLVILPG